MSCPYTFHYDAAAPPAEEALSLGRVRPSTRYRVECRRPDGSLRWAEDVPNLVVTQGLNKLIDATFKTGLASPAWFVGLKGTGSVILGDTLASHTGWAEINPYTGNRPAFTPGSVSGGSVDNSASKAVYAITGTTTVYGAFLCDQASGNVGNLYGAADFGTARSVISGDSLSVSVTPSVS